MSAVVIGLFEAIRMNSNARHGINWLTFQDMFGRRNDWLDPTANTTLNWYKMFRDTQMFDSVGVTPELFETTATTYGTADGPEVYGRLDDYNTLGIPIRFMFELRYWYDIELNSGKVDSELEAATIQPGPIEDLPPYMSTKIVKPGDPLWLDIKGLVDSPSDLVEATIIGVHDD
jgi:hypothetical protein